MSSGQGKGWATLGERRPFFVGVNAAEFSSSILIPVSLSSCDPRPPVIEAASRSAMTFGKAVLKAVSSSNVCLQMKDCALLLEKGEAILERALQLGIRCGKSEGSWPEERREEERRGEEKRGKEKKKKKGKEKRENEQLGKIEVINLGAESEWAKREVAEVILGSPQASLTPTQGFSQRWQSAAPFRHALFDVLSPPHGFPDSFPSAWKRNG